MVRDTCENAVQGILPNMSDHARANGPPPVSQKPKHRSKHGDENYHTKTLVRKSHAKRSGRNENCGGKALREGRELSLQVASKDRLLADARGDRERDPPGKFHSSVREHELEVGTICGNAQEPADNPK